MPGLSKVSRMVIKTPTATIKLKSFSTIERYLPFDEVPLFLLPPEMRIRVFERDCFHVAAKGDKEELIPFQATLYLWDFERRERLEFFSFFASSGGHYLELRAKRENLGNAG